MLVTGRNYLGSSASAEGDKQFTAYSTSVGAPLDERFHEATESEVGRAVELADSAFPVYRALAPEKRAEFLEAIAASIVELGEDLLQTANRETGLPAARLTGERARTVNQLKLFAQLIREGSWVDARIDTVLPDRAPLPRPDLRRMLIALGPVAVFAASNFPFAFSVAGGDTASALAAGCPVIVKAHPAHPATSELTAGAVLAAARATGMPDGVFSLLHGGVEAGVSLVRHPLLKAVGFTGSQRGGRALMDVAAARPEPIPVYAEMGSVNPVYVFPEALESGGEKLAAGLAQSVTLGVGQFCTNPGVVVGLKSDALDKFTDAVAENVAKVEAGPMLSLGICNAYNSGAQLLLQSGQVRAVHASQAAQAGWGAPAVFTADASAVLAQPELLDEIFGPSTLIIGCASEEELRSLTHLLPGQLTATVHASGGDLGRFSEIISLLETKAGRILFSGFPTGVEVSPAMQHGGPYPATGDSRSTSVGTAAIYRFARPVCWQDAPEAVLPLELRNANSRGIMRLVDGTPTKEPLV